MADELDPTRRLGEGWPDDTHETEASTPDSGLHAAMGVAAAGIGGTQSGFPVGAVTDPDLLHEDDSAQGPRDEDDDGDPPTPG